VVRATRKQGLHAGGLHPALQPARQVPGDVRLIDPGDGDAEVGTTVAGIDDDAFTPKPWTRPAQMFLFAEEHRPATTRARRQLPQRPHGRRTTDTVHHQPIVTLEVLQSPLGLWTETTVRPSGVVAEFGQPFLQREHVVTVH